MTITISCVCYEPMLDSNAQLMNVLKKSGMPLSEVPAFTYNHR
jgi:hypothetical protein